jgi:hypothetical protein
LGQPETGGARCTNGRRQPSRGGTSRMNREVHVRMCVQERLACSVGRQAYRGNSQKPRSLDSRVAGNQDSEAYRQGLPRGDHESPGRNESERECGLENEWIRGPSLHPKGEGSMGSRNLNDAATSPWRGGMRQHGDKDMPSNWRSPPRPAEKSAEQGRSYNRLNREIDRRREGGGWARSSDEAE